jgi:hypothetical protein
VSSEQIDDSAHNFNPKRTDGAETYRARSVGQGDDVLVGSPAGGGRATTSENGRDSRERPATIHDNFKPTTPADVSAFLIANWERYTVRELARMTGSTDKAVRDRARVLHLMPRRQLALAKVRKLEADRIARRNAVKPLPLLATPTPYGWSDGWSIAPPTLARLRAGR